MALTDCVEAEAQDLGSKGCWAGSVAGHSRFLLFLTLTEAVTNPTWLNPSERSGKSPPFPVDSSASSFVKYCGHTGGLGR